MKTNECSVYAKIDIFEWAVIWDTYLSCDIEYYKSITELIISEEDFEIKKSLFLEQFSDARIHEWLSTEQWFYEALDLMRKAIVWDTVAYPNDYEDFE